MTPASRAPGVSSVGMIRAVMASTSTVSSGVKNSNFGGVAAFAALCACVAADSTAGQVAVIHATLRPVPVRRRKLRRFYSFILFCQSFPQLPALVFNPFPGQKILGIHTIEILHTK